MGFPRVIDLVTVDRRRYSGLPASSGGARPDRWLMAARTIAQSAAGRRGGGAAGRSLQGERRAHDGAASLVGGERRRRVDHEAPIAAIADLSIVGVRKKPAGLAANLQRAEQGLALSQQDMVSLQSRGYYITGAGQLMSNEGDLQAATQGGVVYTMRFGEVVYGSGEAVTAGTDQSDQAAAGKGENRYLFITAEFDPSILAEPPRPASTSFDGKAEADLTDAEKADKAIADVHKDWQTKFDAAQARASELNHRFADWYYVISAANFDKLHLKRSDLVKEKVAS